MLSLCMFVTLLWYMQVGGASQLVPIGALSIA